MNYEVEYIEENNYLIRKFKGALYLQDILASWEFLIENKLKMYSYIGIINDFTEAELQMELDDLEQIMNLFKNNIEIFKNLKLAVLMTSPQNIIFPLFAQKNSPFNIKAFSTIDAAKNWIISKEF